MKITVTTAISLMLASAALPLAANARAETIYQFQSPSGNIDCVMSSIPHDSASCEIRDQTWVAPPRPSRCLGTWGDRIDLNQGSAPALVCHTDTDKASGLPTLQYGQTASLNSLTCASETSGMICKDLSTGHYFRLARDDYELD